jgi:cytochrome c biogenesis protein CcdA
VLRLLGLVISIGLADSINPSTIAPALYLSAGNHARRQVTMFTASVFAVNLAAGALVAIGPGQILRDAISDVHVEQTIRHVAELVAGIVLIGAAVMLWRRRHLLVRRGLPQPRRRGHSSALLGATIAAVELPTAFPYFAAIAAILASGFGPVRQLVALIVFNLCFVAPLIGIIGVLTFAGDRSERILTQWRQFLERRWPHLTAALLLIVGVLALVFGATGLAAQTNTNVGHFFKHIRRTLHLHP